jgi:hypothetical protein
MQESGKVVGRLLNTRNDGSLVFRVYNKENSGETGYTDYELAVDDLRIEIDTKDFYIKERVVNGKVVKEIRDSREIMPKKTRAKLEVLRKELLDKKKNILGYWRSMARSFCW